jgi:hypothetical protein
MTAPLKVFFSYAHADEAHRKTLAKHLSPLEDEGHIAVWHDRKITGGRAWAGAIDAALRSADIVLLLISADFLDSDYCNDVELTDPPSECNDPPLAIRELLADDLCRFVDRPQPTLSAAARSLRQGLAMPEDCTGSIRNTTPPGGASTTSL